jgi:hypothetical protein
MTDYSSDDRLSQLIEDLGDVDPPAALTRQVMGRISQEPRHEVRRRIIQFNRGDTPMTRKAMWGLAAAAVIVLGVYTITGFPPVGRGTEGTIGAAQKYQAPQISDKDVTLGDGTAQEFLQSEAFDQLAKDPDARDLVSNVNMRNILADAAFRRELASRDVRAVLSNQAIHNVFADALMRQELEDQLKANMSAEAVKKAMGTDVRGSEARAAVARMLSDAGVRSVLQKDVIRQALSNGELRQVMSNARMARAVNANVFANAVAARGFAASLRTGALATALAGR